MDEHGVVAVCFEVGLVTRAGGSSLKSADLLCSVKTQNTENIRPKMLYFIASQTKENFVCEAAAVIICLTVKQNMLYGKHIFVYINVEGVG